MRQMLVSPKSLLWLPIGDGQVSAYGLRAVEGGQAYYAPVGLTAGAYEDLLKSLPAEPAARSPGPGRLKGSAH